MVELSGPRNPSWRYVLLDVDDNPIRDLTFVSRFEWKCDGSRLGGSGTLVMDDTADWLSGRVQVIYDPGILGVGSWPVATAVLSSPTEQHHGHGRVSYESALLSKVSVVDEDTTDGVLGFDAGANIIDAVVGLIQSCGEEMVKATVSDKVLAAAMSWPVGTPKLDVINDLLLAADYWALSCDGGGWFLVEPYERPGDREISYSFEAGEAAIHSPVWSRAQDLSSVPNRFFVVGRGDDTTPALFGVATNEDPESPFSFQARGRWVTRVEEGVEAASQAEYDALAVRGLADAMSPAAMLDVSHAVVPLSVRDVVLFSPSSGGTRRAVVESMEFGSGFSAQVGASWREVVLDG